MSRIEDAITLAVCIAAVLLFCSSVARHLSTSEVWVQAHAISEHELECYGDIPSYDGMIYDTESTLKVGVDYWIEFNTHGTETVCDDTIEVIN